MSETTVEIPPRANPAPIPAAPASAPAANERKALTKKELAADHPTWCPGCGDFSVLALYFKLLEKRKLWHEKIATIAGIGCSSRFPYFVQANGAHFLHGRALPFASGVSLTRPDMHVFVFGGDGDAFSIGGNHVNHTARRNVKMTYVVMDNWVYGLTKKQTSPTSPIGFKSKTDMWGAFDQPINPMKQLIAAGATFVARATHTNANHLLQMMEAAMDHDGFSVIECLSECVEFYDGAFDASNPRKGGKFELVPATHDVRTNWPPTNWPTRPSPVTSASSTNPTVRPRTSWKPTSTPACGQKVAGKKDWEILQATFNRLK
jgi:2-oxoglutarate ferredoxin oxidoreductase subunit beta